MENESASSVNYTTKLEEKFIKLNFKILIFLSIVFCSACTTSTQQPKLIQTIEFGSDEVFSEGAEFSVRKIGNGCVVGGIVYTSYYQIEYQFDFRGSSIGNATKIVRSYEEPIFENPNPNIANTNTYNIRGNSNEMRTINIIYESISQDSKLKCT